MDFTRVIENKKINKLWCDKYAPNSLEKNLWKQRDSTAIL